MKHLNESVTYIGVRHLKRKTLETVHRLIYDDISDSNYHKNIAVCGDSSIAPTISQMKNIATINKVNDLSFHNIYGGYYEYGTKLSKLDYALDAVVIILNEKIDIFTLLVEARYLAYNYRCHLYIINEFDKYPSYFSKRAIDNLIDYDIHINSNGDMSKLTKIKEKLLETIGRIRD